MRRYVVGALCGASAFAVTYALLIVGFEAARGRTIRFASLADLVVALSVINMAILLAVQGPIRLAIRRFSSGIMFPENSRLCVNLNFCSSTSAAS